MTWNLSKTARAAAAALLAVFLWSGPGIAGGEYSGNGVAILTVTGNLQNPSRGAYDDATDKFFGFNDIGFESGAQFDFQGLQKLGMIAVTTDFPKGGDIHTFEGPRLEDVLAAAGVQGRMLTIRALDGYAIDAPVEQLIAQGAVVALKRDGRPFGIGDFGPTQIVFPRAERPDLADMNDDNWVWSIYHISVE
jgi:hypothetical protein